MPIPGRGPAAGLVGQLAVLAVLAATAGLGIPGWFAGVAYGVALSAVLTRGLRRTGTGVLGPADRITLTRSVLVGGVTALTAESFVRAVPVAVLFALTAVALVLDAVDGRVARGTGTVSELGFRFDMEVDAFLLLVLGAYLAPAIGGWVLAIGGMRYAWVAATWVIPWLGGPLPSRYRRKVVAATQGVVLLAAVPGLLPKPVCTLALVVALALLVESFGWDVAWRWNHGRDARSDIRGAVRGGPVRRGRHAGPAARQRRGPGAPGGGVAGRPEARPAGGLARVATGAGGRGDG